MIHDLREYFKISNENTTCHVTLDVLLFGDSSLSLETNSQIFFLVHKFLERQVAAFDSLTCKETRVCKHAKKREYWAEERQLRMIAI